MTDARYTLEMGGKLYGFTLGDVDFSAKRDDLAYGLGETIIDSMEVAGHDEATVALVVPKLQKRFGFKVALNREDYRNLQVMGVGRQMVDLTYKALEGAA